MAVIKQRYPTVRVRKDTYESIRGIADEDAVPMSDVVAQAVKEYRQKRLLEKSNRAWAKMMEDPEERAFWKQEDEEIERVFLSPIIDPREEEDEES